MFPCPPNDEFGGQTHRSETRQAVEPYRYPNGGGGGRLRGQTPDLYRVNFDVNNLKPLAALLFCFHNPQEQPWNGLFLVTNW